MHQYISGEKDIQLVIECLAYQQTHHMALTDCDLTDSALYCSVHVWPTFLLITQEFMNDNHENN